MSLKITPRLIFELAALFIAGWLLFTMGERLMHSHNFALRGGQPVFGDFIGFWSAGRATLDGHIDRVHDIQFIYQYHHVAAPGVRFIAWWNAPPPFLLPMVLLARLPYGVAALIWLSISIAVYLFAAWKVLADKRAFLFAVTMPAALYHFGNAQVGLLFAGITALALYWLDKRPRLAGALVGLLVIKPHLAILWPVLLAITGRWRAFFAATASFATLIMVAGLVFGWESYVRFFHNLETSETLMSGLRVTTPSYAALYANLLKMHVPQMWAIGAHAVSAFSAFILAVWIFKRGDKSLQAAALCSATLLITPYLFFYDFVLLGAGLAFLGTPRNKLEIVAYVLGWSAALSLAIGYYAPVPLCPIAAWSVLLITLRRLGSVALPQAQAQPT